MSSTSEPGQKGKKILQNVLAYGVVVVVCLATLAYSGIRRFGHNSGGYWFSKGLQYDLGKGVTQDYVKARDFYQKAAGAGNTQAMNNLGILYEQGQGGPQDYEKAHDWYLKAANAGSAKAMNNLADLYEKGEGVTKDYAKGRQWYQKSADKGNVAAKQALSRLAALQSP